MPIKHLLSINVYDKHEWVNAWERQFTYLPKERWDIQVVCNGPRPKSDWLHVPGCEGLEPTDGYKRTLEAVTPLPETGMVVSVHAKTVLNDIRYLDLLAEGLVNSTEHDGAFLNQEQYITAIPDGRVSLSGAGQECLFMFMVRASRWSELMGHFLGCNLGTEPAMTAALEATKLNVLRLNVALKNFSAHGERNMFMCGGGLMNMYGVESPGPHTHPHEYWTKTGLNNPLYTQRCLDINRWFSMPRKGDD